MTDQTAASYPRIRARFGDGAIDKVTRIFSAGLDDIFTELLQNARRAGATQVSVTTDHADDVVWIIVNDDGAGISDPQMLLTFGESDWDGDVQDNEDPAGMGILALSRFGCMVRSVSGPNRYEVELTPDHFMGKLSADVVPDIDRMDGVTTSVAFEYPHTPPHDLADALRPAAEYCAVPVTLDGEKLPQSDFLAYAVHTETWRGLRLGIFRTRGGSPKHNLNFFGRTIEAWLPSVATLDRENWYVKADLVACPELQLVLPARKELVRTEFLPVLRDAALAVIFRAMAISGSPPDLAWADWDRARRAGVNLPAAAPRLKPWQPGSSNAVFEYHESLEPVLLDEEALPDAIVARDFKLPPLEFPLERALLKSGILHRIFQADDRLDGYAWYDAISVLNDFSVWISEDGERTELAEYINHLPKERDSRVDRVDFCLLVAESAAENTVTSEMWVQGDVALESDQTYVGGPMRALVSRDSKISHYGLRDLIYESFFRFDANWESESFGTQIERAREWSYRIALTMLVSEDAACIQLVHDLVYDHVLDRTQGRDMDIRIRGRQVDVSIVPEQSEES